MAGLLDAISIGLSGLTAADAQLNVTAKNIANLNTSGYKSERVDLVELSGGGVRAAGISRDTSKGALDATGVEGSNVDLAAQAVDLIREKSLYRANALVVKTADQLLGSLLDIFDHGQKSRRGTWAR